MVSQLQFPKFVEVFENLSAFNDGFSIFRVESVGNYLLAYFEVLVSVRIAYQLQQVLLGYPC